MSDLSAWEFESSSVFFFRCVICRSSSSLNLKQVQQLSRFSWVHWHHLCLKTFPHQFGGKSWETCRELRRCASCLVLTAQAKLKLVQFLAILTISWVLHCIRIFVSFLMLNLNVYGMLLLIIISVSIFYTFLFFFYMILFISVLLHSVSFFEALHCISSVRLLVCLVVN